VVITSRSSTLSILLALLAALERPSRQHPLEIVIGCEITAIEASLGRECAGSVSLRGPRRRLVALVGVPRVEPRPLVVGIVAIKAIVMSFTFFVLFSPASVMLATIPYILESLPTFFKTVVLETALVESDHA
jgi:hypothetical protein